MTRRQRTTGLPRSTRRDTAPSKRRRFTERHQHLLIVGAAFALLIAVIGIFGYRWYDDNYLRPNKVIITVGGEEEFNLGYYADRLIPFYQASGSSLTVAEQQLLSKLEEEGLTLVLARERGIEITDADITQAIADELGIPADSPGFDATYRQHIDTLGMSNSNYRQLTEASVADTRIREQLREEIGTTGETVMLRMVVVATTAAADDIIARIEGGEDMGEIASTESLDLATRADDGLDIRPRALFPAGVQAGIEEAAVGDLAGPIQVGDNVWVVRVERIDPEGELSGEQIDELVEIEMSTLLGEARSRITIERNVSNDDIRWAERNAG